MKNKEYRNKEKKLVQGSRKEDLIRLFTELMDNATDVIYFKDREGKIVLVNKAYARGLGITPDEVIGKTDFDIFPKKRAKIMQKDDSWVIENKKPIIDKIERATRPDGEDNYVSTTKIPRFDEKGKVIGLIGITRDITRRRRLEQLEEDKKEMQKKINALKEINKMKLEFISIVSHELRTPLAIINQVVMILLDELVGKLNERQKNITVKAKNSINRLSHMINKLLDVSRMERGVLQLNYALVNLKSLLEDIGDSFQEIAGKQGINIEYDFCQQEVNLFCDPERITQIVSNLVDNAIKFTEEKGKIKIELKHFKDQVRVGVLDTGFGIPKNKLDKIFGKFTQISGLSRSNKEGVGLGLALVKDIVDKHKGKVWAESRVGVGSKFYFILPLVYRFQLTNNEIINTINNALAKDLFVYLIEVILIKSKRGVSGKDFVKKDFFVKVKNKIEEVVKSCKSKDKVEIEIAGADYKKRTISIISAGKNKEKLISFCKTLNKRLKEFLTKGKKDNVFINLGSMDYPQEKCGIDSKQLTSYFNLRKIFTGVETRRLKRYRYQAICNIVLPSDGKLPGQTIDISKGGICFQSSKKIKKRDKIKAELEVPQRKKGVIVEGRVAWVEKIRERVEKEGAIYKVGIEFSQLGKKEKDTINQAIKQVSKNK
ncbi:MAG: ATP-binding protein [Candidatus Omnitrophota bacterium]